MTVLSLGYLLLERTGDYLLEQLDSELTSEAKGAIFILSNPEYKISSYQTLSDNSQIHTVLEFLSLNQTEKL
ncbi:MAG: hypothetical protein CM15mP86_05550 [Gammaproteobacteria bacterium]|nr:MAG: hypothetical protein CM15mP86_05550 [Gammaproteobacteria bacterium]